MKCKLLIDLFHPSFHLAEGTVSVISLLSSLEVRDADRLRYNNFVAGAEVMLPLSYKVAGLPHLKR